MPYRVMPHRLARPLPSWRGNSGPFSMTRIFNRGPPQGARGPHDPPDGQRRSHFRGETPPGRIIHTGQQATCAALGQRSHHQLHGPPLVRLARQRSGLPTLPPGAFPAVSAHHTGLLAIQPIDAPMIDAGALPAQEGRSAPIPKTSPCHGQLAQLLPQRLRVNLAALMAVRAAAQARQCTRAAHAQASLLHGGDRLLPLGWCEDVLARAAFANISSARSATRRFSRAFSPANCRSHLRLLTGSPRTWLSSERTCARQCHTDGTALLAWHWPRFFSGSQQSAPYG
jgi:hypothetical protein